jgi:HK97 gp10 family phage protein
MSGQKVEITGLNRLVRKLEALPDKLARKVLRPAIIKAATPIVKGARRNAPEGAGKNPDGTERKHLNKNIGKKVRTYKGSNTIVAVMGAMGRETPHANIVEGGTVQRHRSRLGGFLAGKATTHWAGSLSTGRQAGSHFLAHALSQNKSQAAGVLAAEVKKGLEKVAKS